MSRLPLVLLLMAGMCSAVDPSGTLAVRVVNLRQEPLPVRAWVDAGGKRFFRPAAPVNATPYDRDRSFSCDGSFRLILPTGPATVHLEKGKEWVVVDRQVEIMSGQTTELSVTLMRWINLPEEGWFSSDLHVHFGHDQPEVLKQLARADDVHLVPAFSAWLRGHEKEWSRTWPKWEGGPVIGVDKHHLVTRNNLEIERINGRAQPGATVGATFLYNLKRPVFAQRFDTRFPTDATLALGAKRHSPNLIADTDKPSWGETTVGAALGVYDVAQLCHNHYHREHTLPGGWGMIGPLSPDERPLSEPDELFRRTNRQYYHWLNCGIRMGVSGGSAMGVMRVPMGYNRTYARVIGDLTAESFWAAVKAGRTFATSGPALDLNIGEHRIGDTIKAKSGERFEARIRVRWTNKLERVELVHNGEVVALPDKSSSFSRSEPAIEPETFIAQYDTAHTGNVIALRSGWFAARVIYEAPDGRLRQAHTSPIYVSVDNRPTANRASAEYNLRWIDRLIEIAELPDRYQSKADRDQVLLTYARARAVYEKVARVAKDVWGD
ncbi:MAG: CehA/McbA family metallohydrolase [Limisphaerales bacterium]